MNTRIFLHALLLFCFFFISQAHSKKLNWHELSNEDYITQRTICQSKLEAFYDDLRTQNAAKNNSEAVTKSRISETVSARKVIKSLKMEQALLDLYQIEIDNDALQHDLDRMIERSQDTANLKALFQLFDNDPNTIAECVSRPYLVETNIRKYHQSHSEEHSSLKKSINKVRRSETLNKGDVAPESAVYQHIYYLKNSADFSENPPLHFTELNTSEFQNKVIKLNSQPTSGLLPLQETSDFYFTEQLLNVTDEYIEVELEIWAKKLFDEWWYTVDGGIETSEARGRANNLSLLDFSSHRKDGFPLPGQPSNVQFNSNDSGEWQTFLPDPRSGHTAIWTGSEMIIWGGFSSGSEPVTYNDGFRYNPITDAWRPISSENAPH